MTYAIVETSGKQMRVEPGRFYDVDRVAVDEKGQVILDRVLLIHHDDDIHVGQPVVSGATVEATVLQHMRGRKILVYKMKPKKKTRKKRGHRQELTRLLINSITVNGVALASATEPQAVAAVTPTQLQTEAVGDAIDVAAEES